MSIFLLSSLTYVVIQVKLNKNYGGDIPKTDVTMLFDELAFGLDDHQYRDAILMIDLFHANLKKQKVPKLYCILFYPN